MRDCSRAVARDLAVLAVIGMISATGVSSACSTGCSSRCALRAAASGSSRTPQMPTHCAPCWSGRYARRCAGKSNLLLTIQRQVIVVLGQHHLRQQPRRRDSLVDDLQRHRGGDHGLAMRATTPATAGIDRLPRLIRCLKRSSAQESSRASSPAGGRHSPLPQS